MNRSVIFPVILIVTGILLLLNQWDIYEFSRPHTIILIFVFLGVIFGRKAYLSPTRSGIAAASFFGLMAVAIFLMDINVLPISNESGFAAITISLAVGQFAYFVFNPKHVTSLVFGILFALVSVPFIMMQVEIFDAWHFVRSAEVFWPLVLILLGAGLFLEGLLKKAK